MARSGHESDQYRVPDSFIDIPQVPVRIIHTVQSKELIRILLTGGWVLDRVRGSHHVCRHSGRSNPIVVPHPRKELGGGLIAAICKQADIKDR
ncbi:type II toxin-antitoxin system HicA family toxin [Sphingomonas bacterium]|uniref:type II toxin-antitoxin system HicA family toxin n=1 Tax=Sphingomonas bacterium TaxID=1895847 RepID=UPI001C2D7AF0|nr:type II toxin-antitoxin system HicA family toxin [Sphingomonas bacterium]